MYAVPWMYLFASKLDRIAGAGAGVSQQHDPDDAYAFLQQHLHLAWQRGITIDGIRHYLQRYGLDRIAQHNLITAARRVNEAGQRGRGAAMIRT